ncbi:MAG: tRNA (adenosine(37)-N6)-threonylcarbamoyltransferase complex transferase subunit TsaD [Chloroflexi bacterium]|nr:tRNA (adenosine(37)-N6)-threonylcarbamoyltransferase complex transferase subunit TsaD [Chloroflexota bacterium]
MILGIETSCDETAAGIVDSAGRLFANVVASQADIHARYGGIVPEVASRQHIRDISPVVRAALEDARLNWSDLDAIAVTNGPGLAGSLMVGVNYAKGAAAVTGKPLIGVNHLVGHVMAAFIRQPSNSNGSTHKADTDTHLPLAEALHRIGDDPAMCLIVSGGHTELVLAERSGSSIQFRLVGETRDDAAGEAFDKAARAIGLPYPGGPEIQRAAENADDEVGSLPRAWIRGTHEFSFSGLKTAVLNRARAEGIYPRPESNRTADEKTVANIAKAFQDSVVDVLVTKTISAAIEFDCSAIVLVGGVAANRPLRETMQSKSPLPVVTPPIPLCTDNGAMIARAGLERYQNGARDAYDLDVIPSLRIG